MLGNQKLRTITGRVFCCILLISASVRTARSFDNCGTPNLTQGKPLLHPYWAIPDMQPGFSPTCDPVIRVLELPTVTKINKYYPCTGDEVELKSFPTTPTNIQENLAKICGDEWADMYAIVALVGSFAPSHVAPKVAPPLRSAATSLPSYGQGSLGFVVADLNGDGNPDTVTVTGAGVKVELLAADGSILSSTVYPPGFSTSNGLAINIIAEDFNGDGLLDLAVTNAGDPGSNSGNAVILLGKGDGRFAAPAAINAGLNPLSLVAADFNGDGKLDLAVANQASAGAQAGYGPGAISVLLGNGDGTFTAPVTYATGENSSGFPDSIIGADFNGDGLTDMAVANRNDNSVSTLLNSGGGKFGQAVVTSLPVGVEYLAFGDFNHDGKMDLLASSNYSSALAMLLGKGDGTFQAPALTAGPNNPASIGLLPISDGTTVAVTADSLTGNAWFTVISPQGVVSGPPLNFVGGSPTGVAMADLNGDGQPDAVITGASSDVVVMLSQAGGFASPVGYSLPNSPSPQAVAVGDLNGDGKLDVVTANADGSVSALLGNGDGTLRQATSTNAPLNPTALALADFNGDGKLDMAVALYGTNSLGSTDGGVGVLRGNGDGTFQTPVILSANGLHGAAVVAHDLNGDGIPDIAAVMVGAPGTPATLAIFYGQPGGAFQAVRTFALKTMAGSESSIVVGDFNGDGKQDIAAYSNYGTQIDVMLGDGTGAFKEAPNPPITNVSNNARLALGDINGDGKPDLVTTDSFLLGNGDGTFQPEQQYLASPSATSVATAKFASGPGVVTVGQAQTMVATAFVLPSEPSSAISALVSAASATITKLAPGSIATAYGSNLSTASGVPSMTPLPTTFDQTAVTITDVSGVQAAAPLFYVSPSQINFEVPDGVAVGTAQVTVASPAGTTDANVQIANIAPGIFTLTPAGLVAADVLVVAADGSQSFQNVYQVGASNAVVPLPVNVSAGQVYLEIFGTGIRNAKSVKATVGGHSVPVLSAGSQGVFIGLDQVNIGPLPSSLKGSGPTNIVLTADGEAANTVNITIQ